MVHQTSHTHILVLHWQLKKTNLLLCYIQWKVIHKRLLQQCDYTQQYSITFPKLSIIYINSDFPRLGKCVKLHYFSRFSTTVRSWTINTLFLHLWIQCILRLKGSVGTLVKNKQMLPIYSILTVKIFSISLFNVTVNWTSLGFKLLVRQNKILKPHNLYSGNFWLLAFNMFFFSLY